MKKFVILLTLLLAATVGLSACGEEGHRHEYSETWQRVEEPTCQKEGLEIRTCKYCESTISQPVPKIDHILGSWVADKNAHWKECSMCHEKFLSQSEAGSAAHSFLTGGTICRTCGYDSSGTEGLIFELGSDEKNYYVVRGISNEDVTSINVPETYCMLPVRVIYDNAFKDCTQVTTVSLPSGIERIGKGVFSGCTSLESITVAEDNRNFCSEGGILLNKSKSEYVHIPAKISGEVKVPESVKALEDGVFAGKAISGIDLPSGLETIGEMAFANCTQLTKIEVPDTVTKIGKGAFSGCSSLARLSLPIMHDDSVPKPQERLPDPSQTAGSTGDKVEWERYTGNSYIGYLFDAVVFTSLDKVFPASLKEVEFTNGTSMDEFCFLACTGLERVILPDTLLTIGQSAFSGCTSLREVNIPEHVTSIGANAFNGCKSVTEFRLPASLVALDRTTFAGCSSLERIEVAPENNNYSSQDGILYQRNAIFAVPEQLAGEVTIPDGVTSLPQKAFTGRKITSIVLPAGLTEIGSQCFENCTQLQTVTFSQNGEKLRHMYDYCFTNCSSLQEIVIPANVQDIGRFAFEGTDLKRATFGDAQGWVYMVTDAGTKTGIDANRLSSPTDAALLLRETLCSMIWSKTGA